MRNSFIKGYVTGVLLCGLLTGIWIHATGFTYTDGLEHCQQQAIEAGAGHWTIDPATGERKFEWGCE